MFVNIHTLHTHTNVRAQKNMKFHVHCKLFFAFFLSFIFVSSSSCCLLDFVSFCLVAFSWFLKEMSWFWFDRKIRKRWAVDWLFLISNLFHKTTINRSLAYHRIIKKTILQLRRMHSKYRLYRMSVICSLSFTCTELFNSI